MTDNEIKQWYWDVDIIAQLWLEVLSTVCI